MSSSFSRNADTSDRKISYTYSLRNTGQQTGERAKTELAALRNLPPFETAVISITRLMIPNFELTVSDRYGNNKLNVFMQIDGQIFNREIEIAGGNYTVDELATALEEGIFKAFEKKDDGKTDTGFKASQIDVSASSQGNILIVLNAQGVGDVSLQLVVSDGPANAVFGITAFDLD
jgi:hypothetical protein